MKGIVKMKFEWFVKTVEFDQVWERIFLLHGDEIFFSWEELYLEDLPKFSNTDAYLGYKRAFSELRNTVPVSPDVEMEIFFEDPIGPYYDIYCREPGDSNHSNSSKHDIKYIPWAELLSYHVSPELLEKIGAVELVSHVFFQMTMLGYSNEDVQKACESNEAYDELEELMNSQMGPISFDDLPPTLSDGYKSVLPDES